MKTILRFMVVLLGAGMWISPATAQSVYFSEDFEGYRGVKDEAELPLNSNLIFNKKISAYFGYTFKKEATRLIPAYTGMAADSTICVQVSNRGRFQVDAWLISREIDLTSAQSPLLTFDYACGLYLGVNNFFVKVTESFDGIDPLTATWVDLSEASGLLQTEAFTGTKYPTRFARLQVDLSNFKGKKIYLAFNNSSPYDGEAPYNPEEPLHYIDNIKVAEKPVLDPGVYLSENFDATPGPNDADFNSYNGWWNGVIADAGRQFKKRIDSSIDEASPIQCVIIHNNGRASANAWLISPQIDLRNTLNPEMMFDFGFGNYVDTTYLSVKVTNDFLQGASDPNQYVWDDITAATKINDRSVVQRYTEVYPKSFTTLKVSLNEYVGQVINIAFNYKMPTDTEEPINPTVPVYYIDNFRILEGTTSAPAATLNEYLTLNGGVVSLTPDVVAADLYTPDGKLQAHLTSASTIAGLKGIYIIRITTADNQIQTLKLKL